MKPQRPTKTPSQAATALGGPLRLFLSMLLCLAGALSAKADYPYGYVRFQPAQTRVTVQVGTTNATVFTNYVRLSGIDPAVGAQLTLSNVPANCSVALTDSNLVAKTLLTNNSNIYMTVNTTNLAQGEYTFYLWATGTDTNAVVVTNSIPFVIQAGYLWLGGGQGVSNQTGTAASWVGGVLPPANADVIFGDAGAQTNATFSSGLPFTNILVNGNTTFGSIRFSPGVYTNDVTTNTLYHTLSIGTGFTVTLTNTLGFRILRDYIDGFAANPKTLGINVMGGKGSRLLVTNGNANFSFLVDNQVQPSLTMSNLENFTAYVNRFSLADYQTFPNYEAFSHGVGVPDTNGYGGIPSRYIANVYLARTNYITATYVDPNNYTNEYTRGYAIGYENNQSQGVGSSTSTQLWLGQTNIIRADSILLVGANTANGNSGLVRFNPNWNNSYASFRSLSGGRMSVFSVADDGGPTQGNNSSKANVDFGSSGGIIDIMADRLYMAWDRTLIASNQNPNQVATVFLGKGTLDVNWAYLGFQEHTNKVDWVAIGGAQAYNGYCQALLWITNGATFRVIRDLTLGHTADTGPSGSALQYNTYGQLYINNSTVTASNIVADGGLNYSDSNGRRNNIMMTNGILIVSNTIGGAPGLPLDNMVMNQSTQILHVTAGTIPVTVKNFQTAGSVPSVLKIARLTGISSYPVTVPLISYSSATANLVADVSALGGGLNGYLINNSASNTVDLYLTTSSPKRLVWTGSQSGDWDTNTANFVLAGTSTAATFGIGDIVTFDDTSTVTNVNVANYILPNQSTTNYGVVISNTVRAYTFNGNTVSGTATFLKQGTNSLTFNAGEQGGITVQSGIVNGNGQLGTTTVASNALVSFAGTINGGLISTGTVQVASGGNVFGAVSIQGGSLDNAGSINTSPGTMAVLNGSVVTNEAGARIDTYGAWTVAGGCLFDNDGTIENWAGRMNLGGQLFGQGPIKDPDGGLSGVDGRILMMNTNSAIWSPGPTPTGTIGSVTVPRLDLNDNNPAGNLPTLWIDVDFANPQTNDQITADDWNNIQAKIVMTNINPSAGTFAAGQVFSIFVNSAGAGFPNKIDTFYNTPYMWPAIPGPGLQWNLYDLRTNGNINITANTMVWKGTAGPNWDFTTANWAPGTYSDGQGVLIDDSAASTTITMTTNVAPAGYALQTNIVTGVSTNIFTNNYATIFPGVVVSNVAKNITLTQSAGTNRLIGLTSLYKLGSGTLTILATNEYQGYTILAGGTVEAASLGGKGVPSSLGTAGINNNNGFIQIDASTLRYLGSTTAVDRTVSILAGGATVEVWSNTTEMSLSGILEGQGALTKTGPGNLILNNNGSWYTGGTLVLSNKLRLLANNSAGGGMVTLGAGTTLELTNLTLPNPINVPGNASLNVLGTTPVVLNSLLTNSGTLTVSNAGLLIFNASLSNFSGTLSLGPSTGQFQMNNSTNSNPWRGSPSVAFDLGTGSAIVSNLNGGGLTYDLGALSGGANTILAGRMTNNTATNPTTIYSIGAKGLSTTFSGKIADGLDASSTVSVTKVGAGALLLNGNNTYTGPTLVTAGTLGGTGRVAGNVSVSPGAVLSPGASIGTFSIGGGLTNNGTILLELNVANAGATNDVLAVGSITGTGTVVVTNVGPAIYNGFKFKLFTNAVNVTAVLPATDASSGRPLTWNNKLSVDGTITLVSGNPATNAPSLSYAWNSAGSALTLSWPADHLDWKLWSNSVGLNSLTNWFVVPGTESSTQFVATPDPAKTNVFFRLKYPY